MRKIIGENVKWTDEEIKLLKEVYPSRDWELMKNLFPNRTKQNLMSKASTLKIKIDGYRWTETDLNILSENYYKCNIEELQKLLTYPYTKRQIQDRAAKHNITKSRKWEEYELKILIDNYSNKILDDMELLLPNRNRKTIIEKAYELNIRNVTKFSKEQERFIRDNWISMGDEEIANYIGKTKVGVIGKRLLLGLLRVKEGSSYNDLSEYIRRNNFEWKKKSMESCGYKCFITEERFQVIHHIQGLNLILNDTLDELGIQVRDSMDEYTDIELRKVLDTFRINQDKYPLGICLRDDIHKLFHNKYGYGNNTQEQWNDFLEDVNKNKYNIINTKTA